MTYRFALGDPVTFTDTVEKDSDRNAVGWTSSGLATDATGAELVEVNTGIIVGVRHLHDYSLETHNESDDIFGATSRWTEAKPVPGTSRLAWVIAFGLRRRHVIALDEHVDPSTGASS